MHGHFSIIRAHVLGFHPKSMYYTATIEVNLGVHYTYIQTLQGQI